jgi:hypothetical protein
VLDIGVLPWCLILVSKAVDQTLLATPISLSALYIYALTANTVRIERQVMEMVKKVFFYINGIS